MSLERLVLAADMVGWRRAPAQPDAATLQFEDARGGRAVARIRRQSERAASQSLPDRELRFLSWVPLLVTLLVAVVVLLVYLASPAGASPVAARGGAALRTAAASTPAPSTSASVHSSIVPTDYSGPSHWLATPAHPAAHSQKWAVDVFYLYPTAYSKSSASDPDICAIDNPVMVHGAQVAFQRQATAFRTFTNIYAPYYRQADATWSLSLPAAQHDRVMRGIPTADATAAFSYYIRHYNHGRPFILAGHSQGSNVLIYLLSGYLKSHPEVYKRMVAAYVIGYSVTPSYLAANPHLKFAKGATDTGVIVSWNTEAPTIAAADPVVLPGALAINPITWTRSGAEATAAQNLGSIALNPATGGTPMLDAKGHILRVLDLADARVDTAKGAIICSTINASVPPYYIPGGFPMGVLHTWDYPLYFFDLRQNARDRIHQYYSRR